ncbi:MAG: hypothetical protein ACXVRM_13465 [Solirubrobacteraceae bacterium]
MTFDTNSRAHRGLAALIATVLIASTAAGAMATTPPRPAPHHAVARVVSVTPPTHAAPGTTRTAG